MDSYVDTTVIKPKKSFVPTIIQGAKDLIRCLAEEEVKIEAETLHYHKSNSLLPHEDMATMAVKYGQSSLKKDFYKFINL